MAARISAMTTPTIPMLQEHMLARWRERFAQFDRNFNRAEINARLAAMRSACERAGQPPASPPTLRARLGGTLVAVVMRSLFWLLPPMQAAFRLMAQVIEDQDAALQALREMLEKQTEEASADLANKADNLRLAVLQRLVAAEGVVNVRLKAAEGVWEHQLGVKCGELKKELGGAAPVASSAQPASETLTQRVDEYHYAFQEAFRSSREEVKTRFSVYLDYLGGEGMALDLGCGRGEWLELLAERGIPAYGVDQSERMVTKCRELGLRAEQADVLSYLASVPGESLGCVTAFHVVEHLPAGELLSFVMHALRVLKPGGILILETPNPENIAVGAHKFYQDITHQHPIPPPTLTFMLEHFGFAEAKVLRLHPHERPMARIPEMEELCFYFSGPQDYGVIARKPM